MRVWPPEQLVRVSGGALGPPVPASSCPLPASATVTTPRPPPPGHAADDSAEASPLLFQFFACLVMIAYGLSAFFSFQAWRGGGSNAATSQMAGGYA